MFIGQPETNSLDNSLNCARSEGLLTDGVIVYSSRYLTSLIRPQDLV